MPARPLVSTASFQIVNEVNVGLSSRHAISNNLQISQSYFSTSSRYRNIRHGASFIPRRRSQPHRDGFLAWRPNSTHGVLAPSIFNDIALPHYTRFHQQRKRGRRYTMARNTHPARIMTTINRAVIPGVTYGRADNHYGPIIENVVRRGRMMRVSRLRFAPACFVESSKKATGHF